NGIDAVEKRRILAHPRAAQGVGPGTERQGLLTFVGTADQDGEPAAGRLAAELRHEPGLANPCLAPHRDDAPPARGGVSQRLEEDAQFALSADEHGVRRPRRREVPYRRRLAPGGRPKNLLVQRLRFGLRLDTELALEGGDTQLVLTERASPAA